MTGGLLLQREEWIFSWPLGEGPLLLLNSNGPSFFLLCLFSNVGVALGKDSLHGYFYGLRTPREAIVFTAWPKIQSQSQIFR